MHFTQLLSAAAAGAIAANGSPVPDSSSADTTLSTIARTLPAPQINVYCIDKDVTASSEDFSSTFDQVCDDLSDSGKELQTGEQKKDIKCFNDYCITTLLVYKCGKADGSPSSNAPTNAECKSLFDLPFQNKHNECKTGGYVSSPVPGSCWSAISMATPRDAEERLPALPSSAWKPGFVTVDDIEKRDVAPAVVARSTPCVTEDFANYFDKYCWVYGLTSFDADGGMVSTQNYRMFDPDTLDVTFQISEINGCKNAPQLTKSQCVNMGNANVKKVCPIGVGSYVETIDPTNCWKFSISAKKMPF